jgi:hypothetical protein
MMTSCRFLIGTEVRQCIDRSCTCTSTVESEWRSFRLGTCNHKRFAAMRQVSYPTKPFGIWQSASQLPVDISLQCRSGSQMSLHSHRSVPCPPSYVCISTSSSSMSSTTSADGQAKRLHTYHRYLAQCLLAVRPASLTGSIPNWSFLSVVAPPISRILSKPIHLGE